MNKFEEFFKFSSYIMGILFIIVLGTFVSTIVYHITGILIAVIVK